uniref:Roadblock/LAMTOR2 domain-containing protein n=1 Tax=Spongospora subterranea TaxID=70186 RepID=A0A0H5R7T2_9EUKA|eukprot:CRZ10193.1 hypothetical protein [Spongospora subterranea]
MGDRNISDKISDLNVHRKGLDDEVHDRYGNDPSGLGPSERYMKWSTVQSILQQSCSHGIQCILMTKSEGSPVVFAGDATLQKCVGGLVAQIWKSYDLDGRDALTSSELKSIEVSFAKGTLTMASIAGFLFAIVADPGTPSALTRERFRIFRDILEKPLQIISE